MANDDFKSGDIEADVSSYVLGDKDIETKAPEPIRVEDDDADDSDVADIGDEPPVRGVSGMDAGPKLDDEPKAGRNAAKMADSLSSDLKKSAKNLANDGMEAVGAATQLGAQGVRAIPNVVANVAKNAVAPLNTVLTRAGTRVAHMIGVPVGIAKGGISAAMLLAVFLGGGALFANNGFNIALYSDYDDCLFDFTEQAYASYGSAENEIPEPYGSGGFTITGYGEAGWYLVDSSGNINPTPVAAGTGQYKVWEQWKNAGMEYTDHIASINGRYLVATTDTYGKCGDQVDFYLDDGTKIPTILADVKSSGDANWNKWGHGDNVLEFEVDVYYWKDTGNPGTNGWMEEEWGGKRVAGWTNLGSSSDGSIVGGAAGATHSASDANANSQLDACEKRVTSVDNSSAAAAMASYSYSMTTDKSGRRVNLGNGYEGTEIWLKVYPEVIPEDGGVWERSCDRGVATAIRWSGTDIDFPAGATDTQQRYMSTSDKWERVGMLTEVMANDELQPGDVLWHNGHIKMYLGEEIVQQVYESTVKGTDGDLGKPDEDWASASASIAGDNTPRGATGRPPGIDPTVDDGRSDYEVFRCVKPDNSDKFDSFEVAGMTSNNSASIEACECRVVEPEPKQELGDEIAELAVKVAATASPDERLEAPHNDPWCNSAKPDDERLNNAYAIMDATVGAFGGNDAYASCTQSAASIIAAVADPDIGGAEATAGSEAIMEYMDAHPEIYEKDPGGELKPGDILAKSTHTMIYVGTKAAREKFPTTDGEFYEASFSQVEIGGSGESLFPGIQVRGDYDGFTVYRVKQKNTDAEHEFVNWRNIVH